MIDNGQVVVHEGDCTRTMIKIIGLFPANTFGYRVTFECRCFGSPVYTQANNSYLADLVNIDVVHESVKIRIDGFRDVLVLDLVGDFFNAPHNLINNVVMAAWAPGADYPATNFQHANIVEWMNQFDESNLLPLVS